MLANRAVGFSHREILSEEEERDIAVIDLEIPGRLKARVSDFELVLKSRFPSIHDARTRNWGKALARLLAKQRWDTERYDNPRLLRRVRRWARVPDPDRQAYGHLRPAISLNK